MLYMLKLILNLSHDYCNTDLWDWKLVFESLSSFLHRYDMMLLSQKIQKTKKNTHTSPLHKQMCYYELDRDCSEALKKMSNVKPFSYSIHTQYNTMFILPIQI